MEQDSHPGGSDGHTEIKERGASQVPEGGMAPHAENREAKA
jgi:hypothetical protein